MARNSQELALIKAETSDLIGRLALATLDSGYKPHVSLLADAIRRMADMFGAKVIVRFEEDANPNSGCGLLDFDVRIDGRPVWSVGRVMGATAALHMIEVWAEANKYADRERERLRAFMAEHFPHSGGKVTD